MDDDIHNRLKVLEEKTDAILHSVKKTQRYFQATIWITVLLFVVPLILVLVAVPAALNSYLSTFSEASSDVQAPQLEELMRDLL